MEVCVHTILCAVRNVVDEYLELHGMPGEIRTNIM